MYTLVGETSSIHVVGRLPTLQDGQPAPSGGKAFEGVGGDFVDRAGIVRVEIEPGGEALVAQKFGAGMVGGIGRGDALQLGVAEADFRASYSTFQSSSFKGRSYGLI